jgi:class 3 adenylate cyclase
VRKVQDNLIQDVLSTAEIKAIESENYTEETRKEIIRTLQQLHDTIALYLPRIVSTQLPEDLEQGDTYPGAVLMADISGFTAFSETLKKMGRKGSEEVTRIVNSYFSPFLSVIFKYDGDLINFSGDALNVLFTDEGDNSNKEERACAAALAMQDIIDNFDEIHTTQGMFRLGLHIGLHTGEVTSIGLGDSEIGLKLGMFGSVFNDTYTIVSEATSGEILMSERFLKPVSTFVKCDKRKKGLHLVKRWIHPLQYDAPRVVTKPEDIPGLIHKIGYLKLFLNRIVLEKIKSGPGYGGVVGEHRRTTVIFLNVTGFNIDEMTTGRADMQRFFKDTQRVILQYDGAINKIDFCSKGTRIMIVFGAPVAHEDDEARAVSSALEIVSASKQYNLSVRCGINSGYIFAGDVGSSRRHEYTVMGDEVNCAARLMACAHTDEIVISESTRSAIRGAYELSSLRKIKVKGKREPLNISLVLRALPKAEIKKRWFTARESLVGREKEKVRIDEIVQLTEQNHGTIISITGEAGIGKSRLCREVYRICSEESFKIFLGNCESFGREMSYLPFSSILGQYFDFQRDDDREERKRKLTLSLRKIDQRLEEWTPIIAEHVGVPMEETSLTRSLDAKLRQQRFFDLILDIFTEEAKKQPVLIICEDLHWVDNASLLLINHLARNIKDTSLLMCCVYRSFDADLKFTHYDNYANLHLTEFSEEEIAGFIKSLLDVETIPEDMVSPIAHRSHGNPLYIEELVKTLIEKGVIYAHGNTLTINRDIRSLEIPDKLESLIMSRIDRLGEEMKNVIQYAAIIGKEFGADIMMGIYPKPQQLTALLDELAARDFLIAKNGNYEFKHVLTQEVAYESLAFETRKQLHRKTGLYIEENSQDSLESSYTILAHHFYKGEDWHRAFFYSLSAGDRAKKSYANLEALAHYDRSLEILEYMDKAGLLSELMKVVKDELSRYRKKAK